MNIKKTLTVTAATIVLSGAALGGVALASSHGGNSKALEPKSAVENSVTDTDNVQEEVGDQTGPEVADANEPTDTKESPGTESGTESDGPGGHEDPAGNVDHQFEGQE